MQRFGKYFDNHKIGIELLKGNFEEAVNMIMKEKKEGLQDPALCTESPSC
jgi:tRNA(Glu) U13 pseudouridine synthase TruD